ncbi:MAG: DUF72 domain-containing protein [Acidimicrobiia bacterium]|nr:DUF72 domain-containing protein [Acidimicrobiia bacterium]
MVRVGTSGWSYPSGKGTWNGVFYPKPRPRGFDELAYYARHFDIVEVNSTFYRMPEAGPVAKWVERTPREFQFAVKLCQKFTHPDMYLGRAGVTDWSPSLADVDLFRAGIEPLVAAGRLHSLLLQFPASVHGEPAARDYLSWLLEVLGAYPLAVEVRHPSWFAAGADTVARLEHAGTALVIADDPEANKRPRVPLITSAPLVYYRFHGRNAAAWWHHTAAENRYNYLYSPSELQPYAAEIAAHASAGRKVAAFMNNHFSAKAVANASVLRSLALHP